MPAEDGMLLLKADTPIYEYAPNTWGTSEVDQEVSHTSRNPVVTV
jgi:hypothetical protein